MTRERVYPIPEFLGYFASNAGTAVHEVEGLEMKALEA